MIYLDNNATTYLDHEIIELLYNNNAPLNPSSIHHYGREARKIFESARNDVANALGLKLGKDDYKIVFTSGGTEANNLVIKNFRDEKIFYSSIEHPSIHALCKDIEGAEEIPVDENGVIKIDVLCKMLDDNRGKKILISIMSANNEIGVLQPMREISNLAKKYGAKIHTDAVQAFGKIKIDFNDLDLDFITISAHKIGAVAGVGALIAKDQNILKAINQGGGQERGERSGTENVMGAISFAKAAKKAVSNVASYIKKTSELRDYVDEEVMKYGGEVISKNVQRLPNTTMIASKVSSDVQLIQFDSAGIAVSNGSACSSGKVQASHVLRAINKENIAKNVIRVSFSINNTMEDAKKFVEVWKMINHKLN